MTMKITKTTTKIYEIYDCGKWSTTFAEVMEIRERIGKKSKGGDKCFACGYKFQPDDVPYLGLIRNYHNMFVCTDCARKVNPERVEKCTNS